MTLKIKLPDDARRELILLGIWFRARHSPGFRRKDEKVIGENVDVETGIEKSEADLLGPGQAIRGPEYVMRAPVMPDRLAEETLLRDEWDGSKPSFGQCQAIGIEEDHPDLKVPGTTKPVLVFKCPTNERGRAEEELLHRRKDHPEMNPRIRTLQGREAWTEEESEVAAEMTYRWQKTMIDFARKGWLRLEPPTKFTSDTGNNDIYARGVDDTGLPWIGTVTMEGLDEAERRIANDPYFAKGAMSSLAAMSGEQRAKVMEKNPWAHKKYLADEGAGK